MRLVKINGCGVFRWCLPACVGIGALIAGCSREEQAEVTAIPPLSEQMTQGGTIYDQSCANCHYAGSGNPTAADLKGSAMVAGDPAAVMTVILQGQAGVSMVNGHKLNGQMPKMAYLTDQEVAAVTAYVRSTFADKHEAIDPALAAEIRKKPVSTP